TSTTLRFLTTLAATGYVGQEKDTSRYYLTYKIVALGHKVNENKQLPRIISPYLKKISETLQESVCLAIEQNYQVVYIDVCEGPGQIVKAMQHIGNIAPLHCTGIGKLFLLNYSEPELDNIIREHGLGKYTRYTLTTKDALCSELEETRRRGYAIDNEECEIGARCIAFPIYDYSEKIIAGISVTGPSVRITDAFADQWSPYLQQMTRQISSRFGLSV
ncbi:MAG: IclR family transcriptional regulator, partial [Lachnospiraceae bacterium]|nr:IclR family transcriptional regulator [Lachnospiraceae bacterium]